MCVADSRAPSQLVWRGVVPRVEGRVSRVVKLHLLTGNTHLVTSSMNSQVTGEKEGKGGEGGFGIRRERRDCVHWCVCVYVRESDSCPALSCCCGTLGCIMLSTGSRNMSTHITMSVVWWMRGTPPLLPVGSATGYKNMPCHISHVIYPMSGPCSV